MYWWPLLLDRHRTTSSPGPGPAWKQPVCRCPPMLLDAGSAGRWAADVLTGANLFAPTLMPFECANVVRRQELSGAVSTDQAAQAHADLLDLSVELWPYEVLANRVWNLRSNLSCYDAAYVALAEILDTSLITWIIESSARQDCGVRSSLPRQPDPAPAPERPVQTRAGVYVRCHARTSGRPIVGALDPEGFEARATYSVTGPSPTTADFRAPNRRRVSACRPKPRCPARRTMPLRRRHPAGLTSAPQP